MVDDIKQPLAHDQLISERANTSTFGLLLPLGILFLALGLYEVHKYGVEEHSIMLLGFGFINIVYSAVRYGRRKARQNY
jgi:hypothetical protein